MLLQTYYERLQEDAGPPDPKSAMAPGPEAGTSASDQPVPQPAAPPAAKASAAASRQPFSRPAGPGPGAASMEQLRWCLSAAACVLSVVSMLAHASADAAWHPADTLLSLHIGCPTSHCCMAPVFESCFMQPLHASISCVHCSRASCKAEACSPWFLPQLTHCLADAVPASATKAPPKKVEQGSGSFLKAHRPPRPALRTSPTSAAAGKQASPASDQVCACHLSPDCQVNIYLTS